MLFVVLTILFILAVIYSAGVGAVAGLERNLAPYNVPVYASDYMRKLGFNPSVSHPLELGSAIEGSSGRVNGVAHFNLLFGSGGGSANVRGQSLPASSVRLGLTIGHDSYILELPYSKVKFVQTNAPATATFTVRSQKLDQRKVAIDWHCQTFLAPACHKFAEVQTTAVDTAKWPAIRDAGLAALLSDNIISVRLTLSPSQYQRYLNG